VQTDILLSLGGRKELRLWVHNVGKGYGLYAVRSAIELLRSGKWKVALSVLLKAPVIQWGKNGQSDISGIHKSGRSIWIEVKDEGKLNGESDEQKKWGAMIKRFGGFYACVDSVEMARAALASEGLLDE